MGEGAISKGAGIGIAIVVAVIMLSLAVWIGNTTSSNAKSNVNEYNSIVNKEIESY